MQHAGVNYLLADWHVALHAMSWTQSLHVPHTCCLPEVTGMPMTWQPRHAHMHLASWQALPQALQLAAPTASYSTHCIVQHLLYHAAGSRPTTTTQRCTLLTCQCAVPPPPRGHACL